MIERIWSMLRPATGRWSGHAVRRIAVMHEVIHNRATGQMLARVMEERHGFDAGSAAIVIDGGAVALFGVRLAEIDGRACLTQRQAIAIGSVEYATARALVLTSGPLRLGSIYGIHVDGARQIHDYSEAQGFPLRIDLARGG